MTIIQNLITSEGTMSEKFNKLIKKSMEISELDEYFDNIDKQDMLCQNESFNRNERMTYLKLEHRNAQIFNMIEQRILQIQSRLGLPLSSAVFYADNIINRISNNEDIASMEKERYNKSIKMYLICTIIINNIDHCQIKQKAL